MTVFPSTRVTHATSWRKRNCVFSRLTAISVNPRYGDNRGVDVTTYISFDIHSHSMCKTNFDRFRWQMRIDKAYRSYRAGVYAWKGGCLGLRCLWWWIRPAVRVSWGRCGRSLWKLAGSEVFLSPSDIDPPYQSQSPGLVLRRQFQRTNERG